MADANDPRAGQPSERPAAWSARRVRASGSSILFAILAVVVVYLLADLFVAATQPLGWLAAAACVALVLSPAVRLLARRLPRVLAILLLYALVIAVLATLGVGLYVQVQDQLAELGETLPAAARELEEAGEDDGVLARLEFGSLVQGLVDDVTDRLTPDPGVDDATGTVPAWFVTGILAIFLMIWSTRLFDAARRQIAEPARRERLTGLAETTVRTTQHYVVGALGLAVLVGAGAGSLAWAEGLPTPLVLGVVVGAASFVPSIGVLFGGVPMLIVAAAFEPATTTALVALGVVVLQAGATAAHRLVIDPRSVRVGPAVVVVVVLVGSDLYGAGGALVAAVTAVVAMAAVDARRPDGTDGTDTSEADAADPAGATAPR